MFGKPLAFLALWALLICGVSSAAPLQKEKEKAALSSAQSWMKLVDRGKYDESWKTAAEFFRSKVKLEEWVKMMETGRKPFGALVSRKITSSWYKTSLPGAPDGEYVIFQFETAFADRKGIMETVTSMLEKDGKWRMVGYFIKEKTEKTKQ